MRINFRLFSLYIFSLFILYLAGVYFGNVLFVLFVFFCALPLFSFIALFIWHVRLEYSQRFSTLAPVKGDVIRYDLTVYNRSFIPIPSLRVVFTSLSQELDAQLPTFEMGIEPGTARSKDYTIQCLYRGRYAVGMRALETFDFLQMFSLRKKIQPQTLYVYPRIIEIDSSSPLGLAHAGNGTRASAGNQPDPTLFRQLREYRDGDSMRHIYWKKYASIGKPVLKEYERTRRKGTRIYFDTRKNSRRGINELEQEDVSVEILVALVNHLLQRGVFTTVVAAGWDGGCIESDEINGFEKLYRATIDLEFSDTSSPVSAYYEDRRSGSFSSQSVIFITHIVDPEIFALRDHGREHKLHFIINGSGYPRKDISDINAMLDSLKEYSADGLCVRGADMIREDLKLSVSRAIA